MSGYDFVFDQSEDGRRHKWLPISDRVWPAIGGAGVERWMKKGKDVVCVLDPAVSKRRGPPEFIRRDNGPGFVALAVQEWIARRGFKTLYIKPCSRCQNAYGESSRRPLSGQGPEP